MLQTSRCAVCRKQTQERLCKECEQKLDRENEDLLEKMTDKQLQLLLNKFHFEFLQCPDRQEIISALISDIGADELNKEIKKKYQ